MKYKFLENKMTYDGSQLRSLYTYLNHKILGDSFLAWIGPCQIPKDKIVDGEDLLAGEKIEGSMMLHFMIEFFPSNLLLGVTLQRLLASQVHDEILSQTSLLPSQIRRDGDDVFIENKKLSISIATSSPVSTLIHFAMNLSNEGTPVETASFEDLNISAQSFADTLAPQFIEEFNQVFIATKKVKWVL